MAWWASPKPFSGKRKQPLELAPAQDETELPQKTDENELSPAIGLQKENRWSGRQAKNTTGLEAA